jgi:hypothetical protein
MKNKKEKLIVQGIEIAIVQFNKTDFISLTDMPKA